MENSSASPAPESPTPAAVPQVDILESIQRNVFPDVIASTIGLRLMGSIFQKYSALNNPELYSLVNFGPDNNNDWTSFSIQTSSAGNYSPYSLLHNYDKVVDNLAGQLESIIGVNQDTWSLVCKVVHGTLRLQATFSNNHMVEFLFIWVQHTKKE